jgi:hypothetical protein
MGVTLAKYYCHSLDGPGAYGHGLQAYYYSPQITREATAKGCLKRRLHILGVQGVEMGLSQPLIRNMS